MTVGERICETTPENAFLVKLKDPLGRKLQEAQSSRLDTDCILYGGTLLRKKEQNVGQFTYRKIMQRRSLPKNQVRHQILFPFRNCQFLFHTRLVGLKMTPSFSAFVWCAVVSPS